MFRELDPVTVFDALSNDPRAVLIDCRTEAEWHFTGTVDLSSIGKQTMHTEVADATGRPVPGFVDTVSAAIEKDTPVYIICRVGGRSANACRMLAAAGYTDLVNVTEGFEGRADDNGHRNTTEGWKFHNLPWTQN